MKAAIFYFTMSGNTELAAKEVAEATGAPLVRLHAEPPYTVDDIDWTHPDARCTREHKDHSLLPRVKPFGVDISSLDRVHRFSDLVARRTGHHSLVLNDLP